MRAYKLLDRCEFTLCERVFLANLTVRKIADYLRQIGYLRESTRGKIRVEFDGESIYIIDKNTQHTLLRLIPD